MTKESEKGQAIILLVLVITALVAVAGLAIDGGRLYSQRRSAQNAADNAALAGAWAMCSGGDITSIALGAATQNGFNNDGDSNSVIVNTPPVEGPNSGDDEYVEVNINSNLEATFVKLVYSGPLEVAARAVARCAEEPASVGGGNALIVLDPDDPASLDVSGSGDISIQGGGVFVDSNHPVNAINTSGSASVVIDDLVQVTGGCGGSCSITPTPVTGVPPMADPLSGLADPANPGGSCTTYSLSGNHSETINPGLYCSISVSANANLTMNPGLYYIEGGNLSISAAGDLVASGVTIYLDVGSVVLGGNANVDISPPTSGTYTGLAIFLARSNSSVVSISGNASVNVTGTIYAAGSLVSISGNGSTAVLNSQVIAGKVALGGSGDLTINYDPEQNFNLGPGRQFIELAE